MILLENLINGNLIKPIDGVYLDVENPALAEVYAQVPDSTSQDLEVAIAAAEEVYPVWSTLPINDRSAILHRLADLIEENKEVLAQAECRDTGKPIALARRMDIRRASENFRFFANAIVNYATEAHVNEDHSINYTHRAPIGVVGCISPWNLPLYLFTWKIAPALATGNCVIAKPSEITPYTAYLFSKLVIQSGMPSGVLAILYGRGAGIGQAMVAHPKIKAISFTGGTETGKIIGRIASEQFKKLSLELGGKNPVLIFDDCDFEEAVATTVRSSFTNQGEICLCGSRILVQDTVYEKFKEAFIRAVERLIVGDPLDESTDLGALISSAHLKKVEGFVTRAIQEGNVLLTGGHRLDRPGYFFEPTVIATSSSLCEINQQEVFGPVVTIMPFSSEMEALAHANATHYGLASMIWTNDVKRAHRVSHGIKSGIVWVNCWLERDLRTPFGGMKQSGVGREGGNEALRFFTETQNICIKI